MEILEKFWSVNFDKITPNHLKKLCGKMKIHGVSRYNKSANMWANLQGSPFFDESGLFVACIKLLYYDVFLLSRRVVFLSNSTGLCVNNT